MVYRVGYSLYTLASTVCVVHVYMMIVGMAFRRIHVQYPECRISSKKRGSLVRAFFSFCMQSLTFFLSSFSLPNSRTNYKGYHLESRIHFRLHQILIFDKDRRTYMYMLQKASNAGATGMLSTV